MHTRTRPVAAGRWWNRALRPLARSYPAIPVRIRTVDVLFFAGLATLPLYFLPSGMPQISHFLLLLASSAYAAKFFKFQISNKILYVVLALALWIFIRQSLFSFNSDKFHVEPVLFIVCNIIIATGLIFYQLDKGDQAYKVIFCATVLAIAVSFISLQMSGSTIIVDDEDGITRSVGTFNNPNQLGYFAVCAAGIISVVSFKRGIGRILAVPVFAVCLYLAAISLSKAAMVAIIFYLLMLAGVSSGLRVVAVVFAVIFAGFVYYLDLSQFSFVRRLGEIGADKDDNMVSRGYGVLFDPDLRLFYGWGEGYVKQLIGHEVHSTLGNILISYGILGFGLCVLGLLLIFLRSYRIGGWGYALAVILPINLYGLTHNGFRFSIFWIFLSVAYGLSFKVGQTRAHRKGVRPVVGGTHGNRVGSMVHGKVGNQQVGADGPRTRGIGLS